MDRNVLFGITLSLAAATFSLPSFSQAMAESVLLGAGSSTAAVSAGSALNSSMNGSGKQVAGRVQEVPRPRQTNRPPSAKNLLPNAQNSGTADRRATQPGELTVSIQGAEPSCVPANEQTSAGQGTGAGRTPTNNCLRPNTSATPESRKYKSVVTVTFPN